MYTHFAKNFCVDGKLDPVFKRLMERLAAKKGWFVPVATLLDHLRRVRHGTGQGVIPREELRRMEWKWLAEKFVTGTA